MWKASSLLLSLARAVQQTRRYIIAARERADAFSILLTPSHKGITVSPTYRIDVEAEEFLHRTLREGLGDPMLVCIGEEYPVSPEALAGVTYCAATDALDGSTPFKMGSNQWAVVAAVIDRVRRTIHAAAIADGAGRMLAAHRDIPGVFSSGRSSFATRCSSQQTLRGCTLAFSALTPQKMRLAIERLGDRFDEVKFVVTTGGNVGAVRILHGEIDCAFGRSRGYDFAPAAFIAEKGGACVCTWSGEPIKYGEVLLAGQAALHPWVIAANEALATDLCAVLMHAPR